VRIIKLMADYQCFPLWEASPGKVGNVDPNTLPISEGLKLNWKNGLICMMRHLTTMIRLSRDL